MCYKGSRTIDHKIIGRQRTIGRSVRQVKIFKNKFRPNKYMGTNFKKIGNKNQYIIFVQAMLITRKESFIIHMR